MNTLQFTEKNNNLHNVAITLLFLKFLFSLHIQLIFNVCKYADANRFERSRLVKMMRRSEQQLLIIFTNLLVSNNSSMLNRSLARIRCHEIPPIKIRPLCNHRLYGITQLSRLNHVGTQGQSRCEELQCRNG